MERKVLKAQVTKREITGGDLFIYYYSDIIARVDKTTEKNKLTATCRYKKTQAWMVCSYFFVL